jgi:uncharacterized protein YndB with AHSA1/START domain
MPSRGFETLTRFADGPTVEVSTLIDAPPSVVWDIITDINLSARFQDEFQEAEWIDAGPSLGSRFIGRNAIGDRGWETTCTIVAHERNRVFSWAVNDVDDPAATWTFRIVEAHDSTSLTYHRIVGPGASGLTAVIDKYPDREEEFVDRRDAEHREHMTAVLEGVKTLAEDG